jgi:hypothetical protein
MQGLCDGEIIKLGLREMRVCSDSERRLEDTQNSVELWTSVSVAL